MLLLGKPNISIQIVLQISVVGLEKNTLNFLSEVLQAPPILLILKSFLAGFYSYLTLLSSRSMVIVAKRRFYASKTLAVRY
jgi:uncharacterized integral membrane protein